MCLIAILLVNLHCMPPYTKKLLIQVTCNDFTFTKLLSSWAFLGKKLNFSKPQFLICEMGLIKNIHYGVIVKI